MPIDLAERPSGARAVRSSLPNDAGVGAFRPVMRTRGIPPLLRKLIGVNEDVLDWVPEERPRYTRLGFIVLNTGLLAALSMHVALATVTDAPWWSLVVVDLVWALIIVTADSWLISSTHGIGRVSKLGMYLPRLVLSALLGLVIAEPLVMAVFHQSINNEIRDFRENEVDTYESALKRCNPPTGEPSANPSCTGFLVTIPESPQAVQGQLVQATTNRDGLKVKVDKANTDLAELERLARDECAGRSGNGLTGVAGEGGECKRNREKTDQYRTDSQVATLSQDLITADKTVAELTTKLAEARGRTERDVNDAIKVSVQQKRDNVTERGLLDEFDALGRLSDQSFAILIAHWLLAFLLVALDCLPVLSKLFSPSTAYDERVRRQLDVASTLHDRQLRASERRDSVELEIQQRRFDQKLRNSIENIGGEDRTAKERRRIELAAQIDRLSTALEQRR